MTIQQYTETVPLPSDAPTDLHHFTHEEVQLAYSASTGKCYRLAFNSQNLDLKFAKWKLIKPGTLRKTYTQIWINGSMQLLHRVIAQYFLNGSKPLSSTEQVDHHKHANGTHQQDILTNLRITNSRGNHGNRKRGSSRFAGVYWNIRDSKWRARIRINNQQKYLGTFQTELEAAKVYIQTGEAQGYDMTVARHRFQSVTG